MDHCSDEQCRAKWILCSFKKIPPSTTKNKQTNKKCAEWMFVGCWWRMKNVAHEDIWKKKTTPLLYCSCFCVNLISVMWKKSLFHLYFFTHAMTHSASLINTLRLPPTLALQCLFSLWGGFVFHRILGHHNVNPSNPIATKQILLFSVGEDGCK